jgi:hypothetical protein
MRRNISIPGSSTPSDFSPKMRARPSFAGLPWPQGRSGLDRRTLTTRTWRALGGGRSFPRPAHPNSNVVTPNSFERSIAGSGPVYIRAVSNAGIRSRAATKLSFKDHLANWFFLEHLLENATIFVACSRYLELGIFDDAALALEEIAPEDKTRSEVLGARVAIYLAAEKWDMAVAVANHLVKIEPENSGWWINLAYATRRCEGIESAEAILHRARELHHDNAMIEFNLACYASVAGRFEEAKARLKRAIELDKRFQKLAIDDEDLRPLWRWIADLA